MHTNGYDFPRFRKTFDSLGYQCFVAICRKRRGSWEPGTELPKCSFECGQSVIPEKDSTAFPPSLESPHLTRGRKTEDRILRKSELLQLQGQPALGFYGVAFHSMEKPQGLAAPTGMWPQPDLSPGKGYSGRQQGLCFKSRAPCPLLLPSSWGIPP